MRVFFSRGINSSVDACARMCTEKRKNKMTVASELVAALLLLGCWMLPLRIHAQAQALNASGVTAHINLLRANHGAPPVSWDAGLAAAAQAWSDKLAAADRLQHSALPYGENVAEVPASTRDQEAATSIALWYAEGARYSASDPMASGGHFTQLVWVSTARIGAGVTTNGKSHAFVVMEFDPPGNFAGQYGKNVLPLSSSSPPPPPPLPSPPPPPPLPSPWSLPPPSSPELIPKNTTPSQWTKPAVVGWPLPLLPPPVPPPLPLPLPLPPLPLPLPLPPGLIPVFPNNTIPSPWTKPMMAVPGPPPPRASSASRREGEGDTFIVIVLSALAVLSLFAPIILMQ